MSSIHPGPCPAWPSNSDLADALDAQRRPERVRRLSGTSLIKDARKVIATAHRKIDHDALSAAVRAHQAVLQTRARGRINLEIEHQHCPAGHGGLYVAFLIGPLGTVRLTVDPQQQLRANDTIVRSLDHAAQMAGGRLGPR